MLEEQSPVARGRVGWEAPSASLGPAPRPCWALFPLLTGWGGSRLFWPGGSGGCCSSWAPAWLSGTSATH